MANYELLSGERISLDGLGDQGMAFVTRLRAEASDDADYFDLLRRVKGPSALPLQGKSITAAVLQSPLYRVAHDIADRVGIKQGYVLAPDVDRTVVKPDLDLLSLTEAADLAGITRAAAHQAISEGRMVGQRVGNAWVVRRSDAEAFKRGRSKSAERDAARASNR